MPIEHIVWQCCQLAPEKCMRCRSFLIAVDLLGSSDASFLLRGDERLWAHGDHLRNQKNSCAN
jgi:hypothetical protein